jgi:hypothetical protein
MSPALSPARWKQPACALALGVALIAVSRPARAQTDAAPAAAAPAPAPRQHRDPRVITHDEVAERVTAHDAFELVRILRPAWLRSRDFRPGFPADMENRGQLVVVFRDGQRFGWVDDLRQIQTSAIAEIRHYDAAEASERWGQGLKGGVIMVISQ